MTPDSHFHLLDYRDYLSTYFSAAYPPTPSDIPQIFQGTSGIVYLRRPKGEKGARSLARSLVPTLVHSVRSIDTEIIHCISLIRFSNHAAGNRDLAGLNGLIVNPARGINNFGEDSNALNPSTGVFPRHVRRPPHANRAERT